MLQPLGDRILIKPVSATQETKSGLVIPVAAQDKSQEGDVIAVGTTVVNVKVGDKILFGKYSGADVKVDGQDLLIMHEDDILGVVTE